MRLHASVLSVLSCITSVLAIFADDAYHIDYHQALLGLPQSHNTFFHRPQSSSAASLLYTVSGKAVLGAVNPKDGSLVWRHSLAGKPIENGTSARLIAAEGDWKVISTFGHDVSAWDALDGKLVWTEPIAGTDYLLGLEAVPRTSGEPGVDVTDVVVLAGGESASTSPAVITRLDGETGRPKWQYSDESGDIPLLIRTSTSSVYYVSKHSALIGTSNVKVTTIDLLTGKQTHHYSLAANPETTLIGRQFSVSGSGGTPFLAWSEKPYKSLKTNLLGSSKISTVNFENSGEDIEDLSIHFPSFVDVLPHFLVHLRTSTRQWAEVFHVDLKQGDLSKAYHLPATQEDSAFAASSIDANVYFTRATNTELSLYSSASHGVLGRWPRHQTTSSRIMHIASEVVSRGKSGFAIRVAETSTRGEWSLVRNGETVWSRPEMLAYVTAAVWADGDRDPSIQFLEDEIHSNPLSAYIHRLKRHAHDLTYLPSWIQHLPQNILSGLAGSEVFDDKAMAGSKTLIVATSHQDILALDAINGGAIKWIQNRLRGAGGPHAVKSLHVHNGLITTYLSDGSVGAMLNATDGSVIGQKENLPPFEKLVQLPGTAGPATIRVLPDGTPQLAQDFNVSSPLESSSLVTISEKGQAIGWAVGPSVHKMWTVRPSSGFRFVNAAARPSHDPVASIGHVLGDRSVLYKYVSPNLALLTSVSINALTMYLIDSVTGAVLHTSTHKGVDPNIPIASAMSENWFAYSFYGEDRSSSTKSYQLIISELFESDVPNDRGLLGAKTNYSSFEAGVAAKPHVVSQAFTLPEPVGHMAVSQTSQGITIRQLLCTLPNSNAIIGIPRHILNPRRPVDRDATALEAEEGLFRYSPILDLDPKFYLTHSREVIGIKKIISSPSLLESTGLVFGYGHDIFGTTVTPSMAFDVLGKGFKKAQLLLTVVALAAGVASLAPMVRKRQVDGRWKMQ